LLVSASTGLTWKAAKPPGPARDWHLHRTVELEAFLGRLAYEDFTMENGNRSVREVALDVLVRAGWAPMTKASTLLARAWDSSARRFWPGKLISAAPVCIKEDQGLLGFPGNAVIAPG
jgi:hypothetical protein